MFLGQIATLGGCGVEAISGIERRTIHDRQPVTAILRSAICANNINPGVLLSVLGKLASGPTRDLRNGTVMLMVKECVPFLLFSLRPAAELRAAQVASFREALSCRGLEDYQEKN